MLSSVRGSQKHWVVQFHVFGFIFTLILCVLPDSVSCQVRFFSAAAVSVLFGVGVIVLRPHRSGAGDVFSAMSYLVISTIAVLMGISVTSPSASIAGLITNVSMLQMLMVIVRIVYDVAVWYLEDRHWMNMQNAAEDLGDDESKSIISRAHPAVNPFVIAPHPPPVGVSEVEVEVTELM